MPTPERIFQTLVAFEQSAALAAALDLKVFTAIGEGTTTVPALAAATQASERGLRILCDYLTILGFLTKTDSAYALAPDSALFLDHRSPAYIGGMRHFMQSPAMVGSFQNLAEVVRRGTTQLPGHGTVEPDNPIWVEFAHSMAALVRPAAEAIAQSLSSDPPSRVLDIAAGHGLFGIAIAQHYPDCRISAVDWAAVLAVAQQNAEKAGVAARYGQIPGDAFHIDFGTGYDVALLTNFLHHFDPPTCESLLRKLHAALRPGGKVITLEMVPNEDRVTPPTSAAFSMIMLATTPAGDAYTLSEYQRMFQNAGFTKLEQLPAGPVPQSMLVSTRN